MLKFILLLQLLLYYGI